MKYPSRSLICPATRFSARLVELARARDRMKTGFALLDAQYIGMFEDLRDVIGKSNFDSGFIPYSLERTKHAIEAMQEASRSIEKEVAIQLTAEMDRYGGLDVDGAGNWVVPQEIVVLFETLTNNESFGTASKRDHLIASGVNLAYWESGWDGSENTYTLIPFPRELHPSFIEVWWGASNGYEAPSFLKLVATNAWEVFHVEE